MLTSIASGLIVASYTLIGLRYIVEYMMDRQEELINPSPPKKKANLVRIK